MSDAKSMHSPQANAPAAERLTREALKKIFVTGSIPTEENFKQLIDSMVNSKDDGFYKDDDHGMRIWPNDQQQRYLSLFESVEAEGAALYLDKGLPGSTSVVFGTEGAPNLLTLDASGRIGVGLEKPAEHTLDVNGTLGMKARIGTFPLAEYLDADGNPTPIEADGKWKPVLTGLTGCHAFEVVAMARGKEGAGNYSVLHAIAVKAHNRSSGRIRKTVSYYGFFWKKLSLRWKSVKGTNSYNLEIRTWSNYGKGATIEFTVCRLDGFPYPPSDAPTLA